MERLLLTAILLKNCEITLKNWFQINLIGVLAILSGKFGNQNIYNCDVCQYLPSNNIHMQENICTWWKTVN